MTATSDIGWRSAHVYYYEPDKTDLLLDAVRPLFARLQDVAPAHVLRHWRQGPHLRLNVRTDAATWTDIVQVAIEEIIGDHLRRRPSTVRLDEEEMLAQHRLLAVREREHGPLTPWFPDNTIVYAPYDSRSHVLTDPEAVDLLTGFYTDATPLLFAMLEHTRAGHDRAESLALGLMLTTSATAMPPVSRSYVSYRSHAEGFIHQCADPAAVRAHFDSHYAAHRESTIDRARHVITTLEGHAETPAPFVREWAELIADYQRRATPLIAEGKLVRPPAFNPDLANRTSNEMYRLMFGNRAYHRAVFEDPAFNRYRVLINYTYLHISRLGLTPPQRFRLCHVAANAVEEIYGRNAIESIRRFTMSHPNR
ncbi:hypothetical protein OHA77_39865 [Streptosporangium sp. NBC_01639]|uniref:thiopeptide maturation pyridine synthase n=1 Tax=Streptosporangium sp. NBC_01639 TaxID=2975948 RepID=UPI00386F15F9|nr:hypothetical protein OHA77_39865 [Streptosporangium sp. NBC_01639]